MNNATRKYATLKFDEYWTRDDEVYAIDGSQDPVASEDGDPKADVSAVPSEIDKLVKKFIAGKDETDPQRLEIKQEQNEIDKLTKQLAILKANVAAKIGQKQTKQEKDVTDGKCEISGARRSGSVLQQHYQDICTALSYIIMNFGAPHILLELDNYQQRYGIHDADGISLWKQLCKTKTVNTITNKVTLYAEYNSGKITLKQHKGMIHEYIQHFQRAKKAVEESGTNLADEIHQHLFVQGIAGSEPSMDDAGPYKEKLKAMDLQKPKPTYSETVKEILDFAERHGLDQDSAAIKMAFGAKRRRDDRGRDQDDTRQPPAKIHKVYGVDVRRPERGICWNCGKKHGKVGWQQCPSGICGHCGKHGHLRQDCRHNPLRYLHPCQQLNSHKVARHLKAGDGGESDAKFRERQARAKGSQRQGGQSRSRGQQQGERPNQRRLNMKKFVKKVAQALQATANSSDEKKADDQNDDESDGDFVDLDQLFGHLAYIDPVPMQAGWLIAIVMGFLVLLIQLWNTVWSSMKKGYCFMAKLWEKAQWRIALQAMISDTSMITADSGANWTFVNDKELFDGPIRHSSGNVSGISGTSLQIEGEGKVGAISNAQFTPNMIQSLLSMWDLITLTQKPQQVLLTQDSIHIRDAPQILESSWGDAIGSVCNRFWRVSMAWLKSGNVHQRPVVNSAPAVSSKHAALADISDPNMRYRWHDRLMHRNVDPIYRAVKMGAVTLGSREDKNARKLIKGRDGECPCYACGLGNPTRKPRPKSRRPDEELKPLDAIAMDLRTPCWPKGIQGIVHYLVLVCVTCHGNWTYGLKSRRGSEIVEKLKQFVKYWVKRFRPDALKRGVVFLSMKTDGGLELYKGAVEQYLDTIGCELRQLTCPAQEASYLNGQAERAIRTTVSMARTAMICRNVPPHLHPLAMKQASTLQLLLPHATLMRERTDGLITPIQMLTRRKRAVNLSRIRAFWAPCFLMKTKHERKRSEPFKPIASFKRYCGYDMASGNHLLCDPVKYPATPKLTSPAVNERVYFVEDLSKEATLRLQRIVAERRDARVLSGGDSNRSQPAMVAVQDDGHDFDVLIVAPGAGAKGIQVLAHGNDALAQIRPSTPPAVPPSQSAGGASAADDDPARADDAGHDHGHAGGADAGGDDVKGPAPPSPQPMTAAQRRLSHMLDTVRNDCDLPAGRRTRKQTQPPPGFLTMFADVDWRERTPTRTQEALTGPDKDMWARSFAAEWAQLFGNGCLRFEKMLPDGKWIDSRIVFKIKTDTDNNPIEYKVRITGNGSRQILGQHYSEKWAPCLDPLSFRILCAMAVKHRWVLMQFDFSNAYMNGRLPEHLKLYLRNTPMLDVPPGMVVRILGALYGLKQSGAIWYKVYSSALASMGFTKSKFDPCIFKRLLEQALQDVVGVHVDDGSVFVPSLEVGEELLTALMKLFALKFGPLGHYLGLLIRQSADRSIITLSAPHYCKSVGARFGFKEGTFTEAKMPHIPSAAKAFTEKTPVQDSVPYNQAVGCIRWTADRWRPDCSFVASRAASALKSPTAEHWRATKHAIRYLASTPHLGLRYEDNRTSIGYHAIDLADDIDFEIVLFTDSNFAAEIDNYRSRRSHLLYVNGNLVDWKSKLMRTGKTSTSHAEAAALFAGVEQALYVLNFMKDLNARVATPIIAYCDCQPVINAITTWNSRLARWMAVKLFKLRELRDAGVLEIRKVPTAENPADLGTKGTIPFATFLSHSEMLIGSSVP